MSNFVHKHAAHCESGAVSSLLSNNGYEISESMCFGVTNSICFAYIPLVVINLMPLISYRMLPRHILKEFSKNIGIKFSIKKFGEDEERAMRALDDELEAGKVVGLITSIYYLDYFPDYMRIHFNGHNLLVYKKEGDTYFISDPVFENVVSTSYDNLKRARFSKGSMSIKGAMYTLEHIPQNIDLKKHIKKSIKKTVFTMLYTPLPYIGIWGMKTFAKKLSSTKTTTKEEIKKARLLISQTVRMQEEVGTGGGGFRYLYASFLVESSQILQAPLLLECAQMMSVSGDKLRNFALIGARMLKEKDELDMKKLGSMFLECAIFEKEIYKKLKNLK